MSENAKQQARNVLANLPTLLPDLESVYKDIHSHPELSMQEKRTAGIAADHLRSAGYEVTTSVGKTGVVGILRNGDGPTIMLRADMDALPVRETTGLPYASSVTGDENGKSVPGHACLRPRHARDMADRSGDVVGSGSKRMAGHADASFSACGGNRCWSAGDD